jgi:hypothetical protein
MSKPATITRFRTMPATGAAPRVDRDAGVIRGASATQAVEALGHGVMLDAKTLQQVADFGNAAGGKGLKVRFTHPGMCSDGLGTMVGHATNFRVEGDRVPCDITLDPSSKTSPRGDQYSYVLDMAENNPNDFGLSIVFSGEPVYVLEDGSEVAAIHSCGKYQKPKNAVGGDLPLARIEKLYAVDFVDEPAANRDGLFASADLVAAFSETSSETAEQAFAAIDRLRDELGLSTVDVGRFAERYLRARLNSTTNPETDMKLPAARLAALKAEYPDHSSQIIDLAVADKDESEIRSELAKASLAALSAKATEAVTALATEKAEHDKTKAKLAALEKLGAPKDPGGSPTDTDPEAVLKAKWEGFSVDERKAYGNEFAAFRALKIAEPTA